MNKLLKLLSIGTVLTGYGITTVFGGKEGDGKNNKNPEEQTPSNQITSPFPQVNAFPQTTQSNPYQQANPFQPTNPFPQPQFPQPSSFPQATPPNPFQPSTYPPLPPRPAFKSQNQQPSSFPQTTPPPSSSLAPAEKGQSIASQSDAAERLKAAVEKYIVANEKLAAAEQAYQAAGKGRSTLGSKELHKLIHANHRQSMAKFHMVCEFSSFIQDTGTPGEICKIYDALSQRASKLGFNTLGKAVRKWKE